MQNDPKPESETLPPLVKLIAAARREVRQAFWTRNARLGLAPQQGWVLRVLANEGPMSLHGLAQMVYMDDPTACRIVKALQERGYVHSCPDPCHGRRLVITVSEAGLALVPELNQIADGVSRDLEAGLSAGELEALRTGLQKVIANLTPGNPGE
jgi:DNA-binding MarR family transcriptional regulator